MIPIPICLWAILLGAAPNQAAAAERKTRNVILITLDGARTQEVFGGLDLEILKDVTKKGRVEDSDMYKRYWAPTPRERREKLLPFFWKTLMARHGSIAGNRDLGSTATITNSHRFSYPGYAEILTGQAHDDVIDSNAKRLNPNTTVLEFLKEELRLDHNGVAAFASWDILDAIVMREANAFVSNGGFESYDHPDPEIRQLSALQFATETPWNDVRHDVYTHRFALAHLRTHQPRVLYIAFGQPDDWSHDGRYDRALPALEKIDGFLRELWMELESNAAYRDQTTLLFTVDHGRGNTPADWRDHSARVEGAQYVWMACVSPDSSARGEWTNSEAVTADQIAATLAAFLGLDFAKQNPKAGKPIARFLK